MAGGGGVLFGRELWDPVTISAQIVAIQCLYYLSLGVLYKMVVGPYVPRLTLYQFFDWRWVSFGSFQGWMVSMANVTNAIIAAFYLRAIVQRAKKCLDFAGTILLLHFAATACFSGFPRHIAWWAVHGTNMAVTALLGEWLCMQKEMQEIPLTSLRRNGAAAVSAPAAAAGKASGSGSSGAGGSSGGAGGGLIRSNIRSSTANIMELGRVDHSTHSTPHTAAAAERHDSKDWGPLSPVEQ